MAAGRAEGWWDWCRMLEVSTLQGVGEARGCLLESFSIWISFLGLFSYFPQCTHHRVFSRLSIACKDLSYLRLPDRKDLESSPESCRQGHTHCMLKIVVSDLVCTLLRMYFYHTSLWCFYGIETLLLRGRNIPDSGAT